jgi:6-pyruvoyltetrahydropterin/6-carboxytetrahydropterin synthase
MRYRQYKFKFYLNTRHAVYRKGVLSEAHPHTWELTIYVMKSREETVKFQELEKQVEQFLEPYQDKTLNEVAPFDVVNPTLENCCEYFREQLTPILNRDGWIFLMLELAGSSNMSYVVSLIDDDYTRQTQTIQSITDRMIKEIKESND